MHFERAFRSILPLAVMIVASGCSTVTAERDWGADVTLRPGWARVREAARDAVTDPWAWAPLAGAAVLQIDHWDRRSSDWARDHTPIFGSQRNAEDWSDNLRTGSLALPLITLLATPTGDRPNDWLVDKAKAAAVETAAVVATDLSTAALKHAADRERPNEHDRKSFPSGHASTAAVAGRLASVNLDTIDMDANLKRAANAGIDAVLLGTGWARVESGWHYPSDALVGMALGHFFASFFTRSLLQSQDAQPIAVALTGDGAMLRWQLTF
ncbi:MAG: phosphatase PAP2 family protein [Steroidobacteraceae bacterium]